MIRSRRYRLTVLARTGAYFTDFSPYVASIDEAGVVAFTAATRYGRTGIHVADGASVRELPATAAAAVTSHPDGDARGNQSAYVTLYDGGTALLAAGPEGSSVLADSHRDFAATGPGGPTVNARGDVAFRATTREGRDAVLRWREGALAELSAGLPLTAIQGIPAINAAGAVAFRVDTPAGEPALHVWTDTGAETLPSGGRFSAMGRFPFLRDDGHLLFVATGADGVDSLFESHSGEIRPLLTAGTDSGFASFRGVIADESGGVVFYGSPLPGVGPRPTIGVYAGPDPVADRMLGLGDPLGGSTVADLALNPASINGVGQVAIRISLANGSQWIVRADPEDFTPPPPHTPGPPTR